MKTIKVGNREAIVDDEDFEWASKYRWYKVGGYAVRYEYIDGKVKHIAMHREIMGFPNGLEVDHINMVDLDNRRSNLRTCTRAENNRNRSKQRNNTSGYKGVFKVKDKQKWLAKISVNRKLVYIGTFNSPSEASEAYAEASKKYHGAFGRPD